jgi:uncharacterized protein (DUF2236 family)
VHVTEATIGLALGAKPIPHTRSEADALIRAMRPQLIYDARTRQVAQLVLTQKSTDRGGRTLAGIYHAGRIDLLPTWARRMHGLSPPLSRLLIRASNSRWLSPCAGPSNKSAV